MLKDRAKMGMETALIILAAGKGTRMQSDLPKVLHQIAHAPLLVHAMKSGDALAPAHTVVVAGHGAEAVDHAARAHNPDTTVVLQTEQLGTAHAAQQAQTALDGFDGLAIVLFGDTPFIRSETLDTLVAAPHDVTVLGFEAADPGRYGRLVTNGDTLDKIVEFKDASEAERAITLCNSGVMAAPAPLLFELIAQIGNDNAAQEFYLTDVPALAKARGLTAGVVRCDEAETMGINTRAQLAQAEAAFQARMRADMLDIGVTMTAPETVFFAHDTVIGRDVTIEPNVVFGPGVTVETGATLRAFSHLEGCHVSQGAVVGPYARLRPGAEIGSNARIGNFVEIKNALLDDGVKVNHLTYIGDAEIGARTNVGAGTVTCNYDGVFKHKTVIGADAFIGSDTMLVAPVTLGDHAMTASGSVITGDVPEGALALGRAKQVNKPGLAKRMMDALRARKAKG